MISLYLLIILSLISNCNYLLAILYYFQNTSSGNPDGVISGFPSFRMGQKDRNLRLGYAHWLSFYHVVSLPASPQLFPIYLVSYFVLYPLSFIKIYAPCMLYYRKTLQLCRQAIQRRRWGSTLPNTGSGRRSLVYPAVLEDLG